VKNSETCVTIEWDQDTIIGYPSPAHPLGMDINGGSFHVGHGFNGGEK